MSSEATSSSLKLLGTYVKQATETLNTDGWHRTCIRMRRASDIPADISEIPHRAGPLLNRLRRNGAPVVLKTAPWDKAKLDRCAKRGAHKSAYEHLEFLREEFLDFVRKGFWMLLPYSEVRNLEGLRLSPIGVVPQDGRRPRVIVDYSYWGVNDDTLQLSDANSMQFGRTIARLQQQVAWSNPRFGPTRAYKVDIGDGFYRVQLCTSGVLKLGVLLPPLLGEEPLVAFPLVLPMGWKESPPLFCHFTETACDLTNRDFEMRRRYPKHPLEDLAATADNEPHPDHGDAPMATIPWGHEGLLMRIPLAYMDVYVDDFVGVGQDHPQYSLRDQRRALLHNIDRVFRPNAATDHEFRKEPISTKKLAKGDASLQTVKNMLGWDMATRSKTLRRTVKRTTKACDSIRNALQQHRCGRQAFQSLLGQVRSLAPGVPGIGGQFSRLQHSLGQHTGRIPISGAVRTDLQTTLQLLDDPQPTSLFELVAGHPAYIGACDASGVGMGGVWFGHDLPRPLLWRAPFPHRVRDNMISDSNPTGTVTNSDFELAGTIVHQATLGQHRTVVGETTYTHCDNTPAVAWRGKESSTTTKARADLLQLAARLRKHHRAYHRIGHLAGASNDMADDASRLFHLSDTAFLSHFNSTYPQKAGWQLCPAPAAWLSSVTFELYPKTSRRGCARPAAKPPPPPGPSGVVSAPNCALIRASPNMMIRSPSSCSSHANIAPESWPQTKSPCGLEPPKTPSVLWARRSPAWGPSTPGAQPTAPSTTASHVNWLAGKRLTPQAGAAKLFRVAYSTPSRRPPGRPPPPKTSPSLTSCGWASTSSYARANTSTRTPTTPRRPSRWQTSVSSSPTAPPSRALTFQRMRDRPTSACTLPNKKMGFPARSSTHRGPRPRTPAPSNAPSGAYGTSNTTAHVQRPRSSSSTTRVSPCASPPESSPPRYESTPTSGPHTPTFLRRASVPPPPRPFSRAASQFTSSSCLGDGVVMKFSATSTPTPKPLAT